MTGYNPPSLFQTTNCDLAGPLYIVSGKSQGGGVGDGRNLTKYTLHLHYFKAVFFSVLGLPPLTPLHLSAAWTRVPPRYVLIEYTPTS